MLCFLEGKKLMNHYLWSA